MLPKVPSLSSINRCTAASHVSSKPPKGAGHNKRRSASNQDLQRLSLDHAPILSTVAASSSRTPSRTPSRAQARNSRPASPTPVWLLNSHGSLSEEAVADATLQQIQELEAAFAGSNDLYSQWAALADFAPATVQEESPATPTLFCPTTEPSFDLAVEVSVAGCKAEAKAVADVDEEAVLADVLAAEMAEEATAAAEPAEPPVRVYKTTIQLAYIKELLSSLEQVQQLAVTAKDDMAGAAAATASGAARFLSRSLGRAVNRVKAAAHNKAELLLPVDALVTVKEFGFTEVVTLSRELAEDLKFLAMEEHDLATGRATLYQRIAHDAPWTTVGYALTDMHTLRNALGGAMPTSLMTPEEVAALAAEAAAAAATTTTEALASVPLAKGGLSLMGLAATLQRAADAVASAAELLTQWAEEQSRARNGGGAAAELVPQLVAA